MSVRPFSKAGLVSFLFPVGTPSIELNSGRQSQETPTCLPDAVQNIKHPKKT